MTRFNLELLKDFDTIVAYRAADLGLEPGEYDFVTKYGDLQDYEHYVELAENLLNETNAPVELFGKTIKPSDIAKELAPYEWVAFVELGIAVALANDLIRKIV